MTKGLCSFKEKDDIVYNDDFSHREHLRFITIIVPIPSQIIYFAN
jgi:hypothetical protein